MAKYRKLGKTSSQRKALLRNQVTALIENGKIVTTAARAEEVQKIAEHLITLALRNKDDFETVTVQAKVARKDKDGKRVKQIVDKNTGAVLRESHRDENGKVVRVENGKTVTVYDTVDKEIKKDGVKKLHARREILRVLYPVTEVSNEEAGRKAARKRVDLAAKLFDEIAPRYEGVNGGYTRIVKIGLRKGDAAMEVLLELTKQG